MPDPQVVQVMTTFRKALAAREARQFEAMADAWVDVRKALQDKTLALAIDVAEKGGTPTMGQLVRMRRYQELLSQVEREVRGFVIDLEPQIVAEQLVYAQTGATAAVQAVQASGVTSGFNLLPREAIINMAGLAGDGSPLRVLLLESWPDSMSNLSSILLRNTALGINPRVTARAMLRAADGSLQRMMRIARTEQIRPFRKAGLDSYRANADIIEGYVRLCAKQTRTCLACLADDGAFYTLDEVMPEHVQGRCTMVPAIRGRPRPAFQTGAEWFSAQPRTTQLAMAGPERLSLLESGRVDFTAFATRKEDATWGPSVHPTLVQDLVKAAPQKAA